MPDQIMRCPELCTKRRIISILGVRLGFFPDFSRGLTIQALNLDEPLGNLDFYPFNHSSRLSRLSGLVNGCNRQGTGKQWR